MELYYAEGNRKIGPIGKNQFQALIKTKKINARTLVWQAGMVQWEELGTFLGRNAHANAAAESLARSAKYAVCSECQNVYDREDLIQVQNYWVCGGCKPVFLQKIKEGVRPRAGVTYKNYGSLEKGLKGEYDLAVFDIIAEAWRLTFGCKGVVIGFLFLVWVISGLIQNVVFIPLPFIIWILSFFMDIIIYDQSSSPGADDYIIDADYPIETYLLKKSSPRHTGELCSNRPEISIPPQKINIDNKARFRYPDGYCLR